MALVDSLSNSEVDEILERYDATDPPLQRRIVGELIMKSSLLEAACQAAYRQISGDYTDGGPIRNDRLVIKMLLSVLGRST